MLCSQTRGGRLLHNWSFIQYNTREVLLNRFIQHHAAYSLQILPQISPRMVIQILVKISHITIDFVISRASDRIIWGLYPQLFIEWIWMRPTGVWMVSVDQDHAFWGQHLLWIGTRSSSLTVVSRVHCARTVCSAVSLEGGYSSIIDPFFIQW